MSKCILCGSDKKIENHHLIPQCYVNTFPDIWGSLQNEITVPLCKRCHWIMPPFARSQYALEFKKMTRRDIEKIVNKLNDYIRSTFSSLRIQTYLTHNKAKSGTIYYSIQIRKAGASWGRVRESLGA